MSTTTSYPQVLRLLALLTAVVLFSWGTAALSPADAVEHGNSHKTEKTNNANTANGADKTEKTNNGQSKSTTPTENTSSSHSSSTSSSSTDSTSASPSETDTTSQGASKSQQGGSSAVASGKSGAEQTTTASKPSGTSSEKSDPAGNNGTIKLAGFDAPNGPGHSSGDGSTPMHPSNDPHLACTFSVEGYGFDAVASQSDLTFEQQAPTSGGSAQYGSVPLDGDSHSGGGSTAGYDGVQDFNLTFMGDPHPKHGYHVKLTAVTDYSQGSNVKHKVFWVEPCETTTTPPDDNNPPDDNTPPDDNNPPDDNTPPDDNNPPDENTPPDDNNPPGDNNPPSDNTPPGDNNPNGGNTSTVVFGAQASVQNSQGSQAATQSAGAQAAQVPTAIESGLAGNGQPSRPLLPLLALLFGLGATVVALTRRKASA
jgi:hypothetical protein